MFVATIGHAWAEFLGLAEPVVIWVQLNKELEVGSENHIIT